MRKRESVEPRQILNRAWMPSQYVYGEGNTLAFFGKRRSTGVRVNSMLSKLIREPRSSRPSQVDRENEVLTQGLISKKTHTPSLEVSEFHSSPSVGKPRTWRRELRKLDRNKLLWPGLRAGSARNNFRPVGETGSYE